MFRRRLTLAFALLALAFCLQGALSWWAIESASAQVVRGRVASDLLQGYLRLSAVKQRLRSLATRALLSDQGTASEQQQRLAEMHGILDGLDGLARRSAALDPDAARAEQDLRQRLSALTILQQALKDLEVALAQIRPLPPGVDPAQALAAIDHVFDTPRGQDMRSLIATTLSQEQAAVSRERAAADRLLALVAGGMLSATLGVTSLSALLALYLARALRQPLQSLSQGAQALQRGDLAHRMPQQGADEFAAVARTLNAMAVELQQHREREKRIRQDLEDQVRDRTHELEQALESLRQVDASRRRLFADISHELRTPTTAIRGEAEIALRGRVKPAEDYQDALGRIAETARHLGQVIDDLLTMARSDTQALSIHPQRVDAAQVLAEALGQVQPLATQRGMSLQRRGEERGGAMLWADGPRLRQVLVLLLDNAIRYSQPGQAVTVATQCSDTHWTAEIIDQGIGIPQDELPRVFERNFRGEHARRHRADGVGLGLPLALALVQAHGGTLELVSGDGAGTTARLSLPLTSLEDTP
ncbi:sensor histidine kinase [Amphibiibacter pelophylacis]|uniref:ATP-binding protein n=1 Tax=Amphibiibacter pelophylacis TaxID=1799477 RepID=A0ACC6P5M9_9BURK